MAIDILKLPYVTSGQIDIINKCNKMLKDVGLTPAFFAGAAEIIDRCLVPQTIDVDFLRLALYDIRDNNIEDSAMEGAFAILPSVHLITYVQADAIAKELYKELN